jgi:hypothetical protein
MAMCGVRVVSGRFMIACFMVVRGMAVMFRCAGVMLRRSMMVFGCLFGHGVLLGSVGGSIEPVAR